MVLEAMGQAKTPTDEAMGQAKTFQGEREGQSQGPGEFHCLRETEGDLFKDVKEE